MVWCSRGAMDDCRNLWELPTAESRQVARKCCNADADGVPLATLEVTHREDGVSGQREHVRRSVPIPMSQTSARRSVADATLRYRAATPSHCCASERCLVHERSYVDASSFSEFERGPHAAQSAERIARVLSATAPCAAGLRCQ